VGRRLLLTVTGQRFEPGSRGEREEHALDLVREAGEAVEKELRRRHLEPGRAAVAREPFAFRESRLGARCDQQIGGGYLQIVHQTPRQSLDPGRHHGGDAIA